MGGDRFPRRRTADEPGDEGDGPAWQGHDRRRRRSLLIAVAVKAAFWPFAVFGVPAGVQGFARWAIYRQDGNGDDDRMDAEHTRSPIRVKPGP